MHTSPHSHLPHSHLAPLTPPSTARIPPTRTSPTRTSPILTSPAQSFPHPHLFATQSFPRFYFIGDDDLLEILGQSKNPAVIQSHLKKLFAGIFKVQFSEGNKAITAMCSLDAEVVLLSKPVTVTEQVEVWLQHLSVSMKETLVESVSKTLSAPQLDIEHAASQVLCVAEMVSFTRQAESAIQRGRAALEGLKKELATKLNDFTSTETDIKV